MLAAHRGGIKRVIIPRRNEKDLLDIPENVKNEMEIVLVSRMWDVLGALFADGDYVPQVDIFSSSRL
jgi:ATP-dependent Lon protease